MRGGGYGGHGHSGVGGRGGGGALERGGGAGVGVGAERMGEVDGVRSRSLEVARLAWGAGVLAAEVSSPKSYPISF
jgi:hypothetical protein